MQISKTLRASLLVDAPLIVCIAAALLFSSPVRGERRQKLYVLFEIEGTHLQSFYGAEGLSQTERALSGLIETLGNDNFGFLEWSAATKELTQRESAPVLVFQLRSRDIEVRKTKTFEVNLNVGGYLKGSATKPDKELVREQQIYRPMQQLPMDVTSLRDEIGRRITALFGGQSFHVMEYLADIPISRNAEVLANQQRLLVPLCRSEIAASKDSKMSLNALSLKSNGDQAIANIDLGILNDPVKPKNFPEAYGMIQCKVDKITFDKIREHPEWHPIIPEVLAKKVPDTLKIVMTKYVKASSNTDGPVAVTPRQGENRWKRADPCQDNSVVPIPQRLQPNAAVQSFGDRTWMPTPR